MVAHNFHSDLSSTGILDLNGIFRKHRIMEMVRYAEVYEVHRVFRNFAVVFFLVTLIPVFPYCSPRRRQHEYCRAVDVPGMVTM